VSVRVRAIRPTRAWSGDQTSRSPAASEHRQIAGNSLVGTCRWFRSDGRSTSSIALSARRASSPPTAAGLFDPDPTATTERRRRPVDRANGARRV